MCNEMSKSAISIYSRIGGLIKRITGINDISLFKKNFQKKIGKFIYREKFNETDFITVLQETGLKKGSTVCIHSSMKQFYNYTGTAESLIKAIMDIVTEEGTLVFPAYPKDEIRNSENYIFNAAKDPTGAGYLAETFRKFPDVKRSVNVQHSVCAWGKYADWIVKDHHLCHDCWDINSPWQKMMSLDVIVFTLGMPRCYMGTFHHCVESILQYEYPYWAQFFVEEKEYKYFDDNGNVKTYKSWTANIDRRTKEKKVTRYFSDEDWCIRCISNLEIKAFYLSKCFPKMLDLGRKGIGVYYVPSPKQFIFDK